MNRIFLVAIIFSSIVFYSCQSNDVAVEKSTVKKDSLLAMQFLQDILHGKFEKAKQQMVQNNTNLDCLDAIQRWQAKNLTGVKKVAFQNAVVNISKIDSLSDSIHIVSYQNQYENKISKIKLVKSGDNWLVDLGYSFKLNQEKE